MDETLPLFSELAFFSASGRRRWRGYAEYLQSPQWRALREAALKRDGYKCRTCPNEVALEVHHRRYPEILGTETIDDLTTLCHDCHTIIQTFRCEAIRLGSGKR